MAEEQPESPPDQPDTHLATYNNRIKVAAAPVPLIPLYWYGCGPLVEARASQKFS